MKTPSTFLDGLNTDLSDFVIKNTMLRLGINIRLINLESSTYAITNIRGTEVSFHLTAGYIPLAAKQFDNVVYIASINTSTLMVELGSFGSPDYAGDGFGQEYYRPLNNLDAGPFRTMAFGYTLTSTVKMEVQPDYDGSMNLILVEKDSLPRLVNTKIDRNSTTGLLEVAPNRPSLASSNTYTSASVEEETRLILTSSQILKISLGGIVGGGQLKYGSFRYFFAYMTEDFNSTEIVGQSSLCQISTGSVKSTLRGGMSAQLSDKQVQLLLTNIDQNFAYLKVYALYCSGVDGLEQQMLEFVIPTQITGSSMTFIHTGFEQVQVIDQDVVNTNFQAIDAAGTAAQINGYLILGRIKEDLLDMTKYKDAAASVLATATSHSIPYDSSLAMLQGFEDPVNTYDYLNYMCSEAYALRIVFVLNNGRVTPPFKVTGKDYLTGGTPTNANGVIRFDSFYSKPFFDGSNVVVNGIVFDVSAVPSDVKSSTIGFFFVRAERNPNIITQGYLFPTLMVLPFDSVAINGSPYVAYPAGTESVYRRVPCVDNTLEAYDYFEDGVVISTVVDITRANILNNGYMPIFVQHIGSSSAPPGGGAANQPDGVAGINNYPTDSWAFISGDDIGNEAALISSIAQRSGMKCSQIAIVNMKVDSRGSLSPLRAGALETGGVDYSIFYDTIGFNPYSSPAVQTIDNSDFVPGETFASGSDFISKISMHFKPSDPGGGHTGNWYDVALNFNSYFGMKISGLLDISYTATSPRAGNARLDLAKYRVNKDTAGIAYNNDTNTVPAAFLINIYPATGVLALTDLYPDTDSLIYKQIGPRFDWSDATGSSNLMTVYDGDTYISKFYRKMYQSPYRDPISPLDFRNIDAGMVVSLWQESIYNTSLRNPNRFDSSEIVDRSFFPFESGGDIPIFRKYRYPETQQISRGYSPGLGPKSFIPVSSLAPFIRSDFFTRLSVSSRHIPNAFANGYRFFGTDKFKDYDPSMGRLMDIQAFRDQLIMVFEYGVAGAAIEARVLTGKDPAGPVYTNPSSILPPTIGYYSRQLGAQSLDAVYQTPSAVYGIDVDKRKIWQLRDGIKAISDEQVSSFLNLNPPVNPRIGYDFRYNEIIFSTDNWTLCFREGLEKFTSLYSFKPTFYLARGGDMFSFFPQASVQNFHKHDSAANKTIYGTLQDCFIEFTVNIDETQSKVFDVIELFSNEVAPRLIEFFVMDDSSRSVTITPGNCIQYSHTDNSTDFFKNESNITFRDKRFIVQIPRVENYNSSLDKNTTFGWDITSRMRNKYLTVRLTYNTAQALQLMSVLTTFRASKS